jgi:hypothetical protein
MVEFPFSTTQFDPARQAQDRRTARPTRRLCVTWIPGAQGVSDRPRARSSSNAGSPVSYRERNLLGRAGQDCCEIHGTGRAYGQWRPKYGKACRLVLYHGAPRSSRLEDCWADRQVSVPGITWYRVCSRMGHRRRGSPFTRGAACRTASTCSDARRSSAEPANPHDGRPHDTQTPRPKARRCVQPIDGLERCDCTRGVLDHKLAAWVLHRLVGVDEEVAAIVGTTPDAGAQWRSVGDCPCRGVAVASPGYRERLETVEP